MNLIDCQWCGALRQLSDFTTDFDAADIAGVGYLESRPLEQLSRNPRRLVNLVTF